MSGSAGAAAAPSIVGLRAAIAVVLALGWSARPGTAQRMSRRRLPSVSPTDPESPPVPVRWVVVVWWTGVALVALRTGPTIGVVLAVVGWVVPRQVRAAAEERTGRAFDRELPVLLDAWARHVRGGLAPTTGLVDAVGGSGPAVQRAMAPLITALQRGVSLEEAIAERWPERPGPAGPLVTAAVAVARPLGGVRAQGLDAVASTVREHAGLEAEKQVQAAQARVSAVVMTVAPLLFCAFLVLRDSDASAFLLRSPAGVACGALGVGLDLLAGTWMRLAVRRAG